jgi:glutamate-1-semialdehyde aminotransferase
MANGFPLSAVVGKAPLMEAARRTWISSTLASESTALAAALAVLDWHDETDVCAKLAVIGREMRAAVERAITTSGALGVRTDGVDGMWLFRWEDAAHENRFVREALGAGVLFKRGAYNFAAIAHDGEALAAVEHAARTALSAIGRDTD